MWAEWKNYKHYTLKHYLIITALVTFLVVAAFFFFTYETKKERVIREHKEDIQILLSYEEDLLKPVLVEEKTVEQLVEDIVREQMGVGATPSAYSSSSVREGLGLFVESAIIDGGDIPQIAAISRAERDALKNRNNEAYIQDLYDKIVTRKQEVIATYRESSVDENALMLQELKERLAEYKAQ